MIILVALFTLWWCYVSRTTYKHSINQSVTNLLVKEVQGNNPTFSAADIHGKHYLTNMYVHNSIIIIYMY